LPIKAFSHGVIVYFEYSFVIFGNAKLVAKSLLDILIILWLKVQLARVILTMLESGGDNLLAKMS
jgi:hypothetical protein